MREGASKLLAACSQREQALEASKTLLTCNARILALLSQLQKMREAQVFHKMGHRSDKLRGSSEVDERLPCVGKVAISDLRIPLMWKDSEYFKNKGELHRCAVFCLFQCGGEIYDTDLVMVDRTLTDICFEDTILFNEVDPGFQLRVELYSSCVVEDFSSGSHTPRRLSCLGGSLGCSSGKKIRAALESAAGCGHISTGGGAGGDGGSGETSPPSSPALSTVGPRYQLLAHTTLGIEHVQDRFKTHDLSLAATEDSLFWLPLYGNMCCRLVAQPLCMIQQVISGRLKVKNEDDIGSEELPLFTITINKDTLICVSEREPLQAQNVYISAQCQGEDVTYTLATHIPQDTQRWMEAFWQHFFNMSQWRQCCDDLMKIEAPPPRKSITVRQGSLYHEIVTPSSPSEGLVINDWSTEIRTLLSSYYKESPGVPSPVQLVVNVDSKVLQGLNILPQDGDRVLGPTIAESSDNVCRWQDSEL
ncbi:rhotekin-like [Polymixia lowei]